MDNKLAFVVLSCDNYSDLWPMYIYFFEKNWYDCPIDKYFVTNNKSIPNSSFKNIKTGKDDSWSSNVLKAINLLSDEYTHVLLTLEDLPIISNVSNKIFLTMVDQFLEADGNYLKFINKPNPTKYYNSHFGIIEPESLYRPTCVYALWKIDMLRQLLVVSESAWEFEYFGSRRSDKFDNFFVVYKNFFKISNTVVKGKWVRSEYKKIKTLGYNPNIDKRNLHSVREEIYLKLYEFAYYFFDRLLPIPFNIKRKLIYILKNNI